MSILQSFFQLNKHQTTLSREVIAGLTTFTTMSYIVVVNPAILSIAGIPAGPGFVATVVAAVFGCLLMALYANRPHGVVCQPSLCYRAVYG
jgi:AGZA family xanthine/uracil permease-like MFS transporter